MDVDWADFGAFVGGIGDCGYSVDIVFAAQAQTKAARDTTTTAAATQIALLALDE